MAEIAQRLASVQQLLKTRAGGKGGKKTLVRQFREMVPFPIPAVNS